MAKTSMVQRQLKRERLVAKYATKRAALKETSRNRELPMEERFKAVIALAELPRDSSASRLRSRCLISGRPRAYYRKFRMSRIALRDLASKGEIPGMVKSSW